MQEIEFDNEFKWDPYENNAHKPKTEEMTIKYVNKKKYNTKDVEIKKVIYTDGGSKKWTNTPTSSDICIGAWAFYDESTETLRGAAHENVTSNQMEMYAAISALEYLDEIKFPIDQWVEIRLDSNYVRFGILFWSKKWIEQNWCRKDPNNPSKFIEIANKDLWIRLVQLSRERLVFWSHVKGHSNDKNNDIVDNFCRKLYMNKYFEIIGGIENGRSSEN